MQSDENNCCIRGPPVVVYKHESKNHQDHRTETLPPPRAVWTDAGCHEAGLPALLPQGDTQSLAMGRRCRG